jgi:hypothetical protein
VTVREPVADADLLRFADAAGRLIGSAATARAR